jgi:nitric oxide reductase subunit B
VANHGFAFRLKCCHLPINVINPPIVLYYMQGLNITANHGHAALFGVYGMLGLGLMLYAMRG